ncbi:hypothetical protein YC2023_044749 [Brassica napus]
MSKHMIISGRKTEKPVRRTHYMVQLRNAGEYFLADVRGCLYAYPGEVTEKEYRSICKHAHLRELSTNLLCTLHSYKGIKHFFALHNPRKGLRPLKIYAINHYEKGNYLFAFLKLLAGDHDERIKLPNLQEKGIEASSLGGLEASSLHNGHLQAILELRTGKLSFP